LKKKKDIVTGYVVEYTTPGGDGFELFAENSLFAYNTGGSADI